MKKKTLNLNECDGGCERKDGENLRQFSKILLSLLGERKRDWKKGEMSNDFKLICI